MGDPRKIRRKYDKPSHPWQRARINEEKPILKEYGLSNKKEIWRMETLLRGLKNQAKSLASRRDQQSKLEEQQLVSRSISLGLMKQGDALDKILGLTLKDVMDRRLQTFMFKRGLARSMKQARQFITHGHVLVNKKKITFPSYIVSLQDETLIEFLPKSALSRDDHPERVILEKKDKGDKKKRQVSEEVPPTFSAEEIIQLEERGAVEKKAAADAAAKAAAEAKPEAAKPEVKESKAPKAKGKAAKKE